MFTYNWGLNPFTNWDEPPSNIAPAASAPKAPRPSAAPGAHLPAAHQGCGGGGAGRPGREPGTGTAIRKTMEKPRISQS